MAERDAPPGPLPFLALFLLSLWVGLAYLAWFGVPAHSPDSREYVEIALSIWRDHTFGYVASRPLILDHVLYPAFLAPLVGPFGPRTIAVPIVQVALAAACAPLAYAVARRLEGPAAGWLAALFSLSHLGLLHYPRLFLTETHTAFWLVMAAWAGDGLLRRAGSDDRAWRWAALLGVVLALMSLTRVVALPLVGVSLFLLWLRVPGSAGRPWAAGLALAGCFALVYAPWPARNAILARDDSAVVEPRMMGAAGHVAELVIAGQDLVTARNMTKRMIRRKRARGELFEYPIDRFSVRFARHVGQRGLIMLGLHPAVRRDRYPPPYVPSPHPANHLWHYLVLGFTSLALVAALRRRDARLAHTIAVPGALAFAYALVHAHPRYAVPVFQAWSIPAGVGAAILLAAVGRRARGAFRSRTDAARERDG